MDSTAMTGLAEKQKGTGAENQEMEAAAQGFETAHAPMESRSIAAANLLCRRSYS